MIMLKVAKKLKVKKVNVESHPLSRSYIFGKITGAVVGGGASNWPFSHLKVNQHLTLCFLKNNITDVQIPGSELLQLHRCDINGTIIKIVCLREIYLLLTKKKKIKIYWKKNLFLIPSRQAGKNFIDELSRLMNEWIQELSLKDIAFKTSMVMPTLLLQKP